MVVAAACTGVERGSRLYSAVGELDEIPAPMVLKRSGLGTDCEMLDLSSSARPRLRGVWHTWACVWSVPLAVALVVVADGTRARVAVSVYAATLVALFGVSALYHRLTWISISARRWMRRHDHSMIFMLIAGTYTPFALLALHGGLAPAILVTVWTGR